MVVTLLVATYMLLDPAKWLYELMELTYMSMNFKIFILVLAAGGFVCSHGSEKYLLPRLARLVGKIEVRINPKWRKKKKIYKVIQEDLRI